MTAIFPEVADDAVRAGKLAELSGADRIRFEGATCLPQGGDVVDVDTEPHAGASWI